MFNAHASKIYVYQCLVTYCWEMICCIYNSMGVLHTVLALDDQKYTQFSSNNDRAQKSFG